MYNTQHIQDCRRCKFYENESRQFKKQINTLQTKVKRQQERLNKTDKELIQHARPPMKSFGIQTDEKCTEEIEFDEETDEDNDIEMEETESHEDPTWLDLKGKDIREEPKGLVFLSKLLLLFKFCHFCFATGPKLEVSQTGTMLTIDSTCQKCKQTFTWTSQPLLLKFPAGNLLLSFAILTAGASVRKIMMVLRHINVLVYNECTYYYHQKHILIPKIVKFWREYQAKKLEELRGKEVVIACDGRHNSMGHSAKFGTYSIYCCTIGLIIHLVVVQANEAGSSTGMEFVGHQRAIEFLLTTGMVITAFVSDRHTAIAKWMREELPSRCRALGKPVITHYFDLWHIGKSSEAYEKMYTALTDKKLTNAIKKASSKGQTSCLESYHAVINHFAPKMLPYSYLGMLARTIVAALHFNYNLRRDPKVDANGKTKLKVHYPKYKYGEGTVKECKNSSELWQELNVIRDELMQQTPEAMHTMYERQSADEAKKKYTERKAMGTTIVPPTCTEAEVQAMLTGASAAPQRRQRNPNRAAPICRTCKKPKRGHPRICPDKETE
ncbi:hypothetical protein AC249_AIPGENE2225 [Exaiptasia diaphana]|nr:hypothetical protein AC249_AIPGENE2225 [Exaiptasia diaphana]